MRYRGKGGVVGGSPRHLIRTRAETLDEALDILIARQNGAPRPSNRKEKYEPSVAWSRELVLDFYRQGKLTVGQAAKLAMVKAEVFKSWLIDDHQWHNENLMDDRRKEIRDPDTNEIMWGIWEQKLKTGRWLPESDDRHRWRRYKTKALATVDARELSRLTNRSIFEVRRFGNPPSWNKETLRFNPD